MTKQVKIISWTGQLVAAAVLGQSLYFKLSAAPEAVHIFSTLGVEPWGRIGLALVELVTVGLLLNPRTAATGAVVALGLMVGAISSHLLVLGVNFQGDGGTLFAMAWIVFAAASIVAYLRRRQIPILGSRLAVADADHRPPETSGVA